MGGKLRFPTPEPEACPAPLALSAALAAAAPMLAVASLALCILPAGPVGVFVVAVSISLEYAVGGSLPALAAAAGILQIVYSGIPRVAIRASIMQLAASAMVAILAWLLAGGVAAGISPVDPMLYYAARSEVERLLLAYLGLSMAGVLYVALSPTPAMPRIDSVTRIIYGQPWLPFELALYGIGLYAAWQLQPLLIPVAFSLGASVVARFGVGKPRLAPLAFAASFTLLTRLLGLTAQLEAVLP